MENGRETSRCTKELHRAAETGDIERILELISNGTMVNLKHPDFDGETPLHHAARAGRLNSIRVLLEKNADINVTDDVSKTPLHLACEFGRHDAVRCLLDNGGIVNAQSEYSGTPLHVAAYNQQEGIVYTLLANGADINAKEYFEKTPLQLSIEHQRNDMIKILSSLEEFENFKYISRIHSFQDKLEVETRMLGSEALGSAGSHISQLQSFKREVKKLKTELVTQKIFYENKLSAQKREYQQLLAKEHSQKTECQSLLLGISEIISRDNAHLVNRVSRLEEYHQLLSSSVSEEYGRLATRLVSHEEEAYTEPIETPRESDTIAEVIEDIAPQDGQ